MRPKLIVPLLLPWLLIWPMLEAAPQLGSGQRGKDYDQLFVAVLSKARAYLDDDRGKVAENQLDDWQKKFRLAQGNYYTVLFYYVKGRSSYNKRNFLQAASYLKTLLSWPLVRYAPETRFYLGMAYYKTNDPRKGEEAKKYLRWFAEFVPEPSPLLTEAKAALAELHGSTGEVLATAPDIADSMTEQIRKGAAGDLASQPTGRNSVNAIAPISGTAPPATETASPVAEPIDRPPVRQESADGETRTKARSPSDPTTTRNGPEPDQLKNPAEAEEAARQTTPPVTEGTAVTEGAGDGTNAGTDTEPNIDDPEAAPGATRETGVPTGVSETSSEVPTVAEIPGPGSADATVVEEAPGAEATEATGATGEVAQIENKPDPRPPGEHPLQARVVEVSPAKEVERSSDPHSKAPTPLQSRQEPLPGDESEIPSEEPTEPSRAPSTVKSGSLGTTTVWVEPEDTRKPPTKRPPKRRPKVATLKTKDGQVALAELPGSVRVLHFWATWCLPCLKELPSFLAFVKAEDGPLRDHGAEVALVTVDKFLSSAENFLHSRQLSYPALYHDPRLAVLKHLTGGAEVPATVVVPRHSAGPFTAIPTSDWSSQEVRDRLWNILNELDNR